MSGNPTDSLTIITAPALWLTKRVWPHRIEQYSRARHFDFRTIEVAGLDDVAAVLAELVRDPHSAVIRGELIDPARTRGIRRLLYEDHETGDQPTLLEQPRQWLALDMEGIERPADIEATDLEGCARVAVAMLPGAFRGARCIVLASGSHGIKPDIRLRLWFWLCRPTGSDEAKRWLAGTPADPAAFNAAQVIYTASPLFMDGAVDPLPHRLTELPGRPCVDVPSPAALAPPPEPPRPPPGERAPASDAQIEAYVAAVLRNVSTAPAGQRHATLRGAAVSLGAIQDQAGFSDGEAVGWLLDAQNIPASRRKDEQTARWGLARGRTRPRRLEQRAALIAAPPAAESARPVTMVDVRADLARSARLFFGSDADLFGNASGTAGLPPVVLRRDQPGAGKSTTFARIGGQTVLQRKRDGEPHRLIHIVPEHSTLPPQLLAIYGGLGLKVAHLRGRDGLCADVDAVIDTLSAGLSPARAACGSLSGPHCNVFGGCKFQAMLATLEDADVIICASTYLFQRLPKAARRGLFAAIIEENFAPVGDMHSTVPLDAFRRSALDANPVLYKEQPADLATDFLWQMHEKFLTAADAAPDGYLPRTTLTRSALRHAARLTMRRKRAVDLYPGMPPDLRRERVDGVRINSLLPRMKAVWRGLRDGGGRIELSTGQTRNGPQRVVVCHSQKKIAPWLRKLPVAILAGDMELSDAKRFFPRAIEQTTPIAEAPHAEAELVVGSWGSRALVENAKKQEQIRTYLEFRGLGRGETGIIAPLSIVGAFEGMQGATVLHHGANAGSNVLVTAGMVATVGGLYPPPDAVARIAAARTGRPVPIAHAVPVEVQIRLRDGSVQTVLTRQYADPDAQAVHRSIYQTSIDQAGMRARPQLRSPTNPVLTLYLASVPPTQPIDRIILWKDIPHRLLSMLVPGLVTFNAIEMAEIYPAQFSSVSAAEHAREKWGPNPRASLLRLLNDDPRAWFGIEFQQRGQGRKLQHRYCIEARLTSTIADIKATYDLVCEPRVVCFKAAGEVVPAGFKTPLKESGTTSPCPDPLTSGLLAGYRRSTAETAARASPDG